MILVVTVPVSADSRAAFRKNRNKTSPAELDSAGDVLLSLRRLGQHGILTSHLAVGHRRVLC